MKSKIEEILYKHSEIVGLYEGGVITCVDENEFDDVAEAIVKLFAIPAVVLRSEQLQPDEDVNKCKRCNCYGCICDLIDGI